MNSQKKFLPPTLYPLDEKIGVKWFVAYYDPIKKKKVKVEGNLNRVPDKSLRRKMAAAMIADIEKELLRANASSYDKDFIRDLYELFEARCIGAKSKTEVTYRTYVEEFSRWYRTSYDKRNAEMMGIKFQKHLMEKGLSPTSINNYRNGLKTIFADMVKFGKYPINPFAMARRLTERRKSKEWFKEHHIEKLKKEISARDPQLWLACRLQFYCFPRPNEINGIRIGDINLADRKIRITAVAGKYHREEFIWLPDQLLQELEPYRELPDHFFLFGCLGEPGIRRYGRDTLSKRHKQFTKRLDFPKGYTFYSWKNTGAVHMLKKGMSLLDISRLMRHKSLDYTKEYFKSLGFEERRAEIQQFYPVI